MEATIPTVKRRQILEAQAEAARLYALAHGPRPVKQADGTTLHLCWSGRVHRAFNLANELQRKGDDARLASVRQAIEALTAEAVAAHGKAKEAEIAYCTLCVATGETPVLADPIDCQCVGCESQRAQGRILDCIADYRASAWRLIGATADQRPELLTLMENVQDERQRDQLWRLLSILAADMAGYEKTCIAAGEQPDWSAWR